MSQIVSIQDFKNTDDISKLCNSDHEPVFITKNGRDNLVVMSIETYNRILKTADIDAAIEASEKELSTAEKLKEASEVLNSLRRKYFE